MSFGQHIQRKNRKNRSNAQRIANGYIGKNAANWRMALAFTQFLNIAGLAIVEAGPELLDSVSKLGPGGKKVTKTEAAAILRAFAEVLDPTPPAPAE